LIVFTIACEIDNCCVEFVHETRLSCINKYKKLINLKRYTYKRLPCQGKLLPDNAWEDYGQKKQGGEFAISKINFSAFCIA
jgi:hypothetical protein